jgi:hypothetical protein
MGQLKPRDPVLLLLAAFSRYESALQWAQQQSENAYGPIVLASSIFQFSDTSYYGASMGEPLLKQFFAFERLIDPAKLVDIKLLTNQWEEQYAAIANVSEPRPLNLDPGYLELGKLVLATTKDHAHRIYLDRGIYAEVTLQYRRDSGWRAAEWTFPDYRRPDYHAFFDECRAYLHRHLSAEP